MPLYEYECFLCGHRFERILRVADASDVNCPACNGKVRRLLSAPALQFKGSGWYVTDYRKGNGNRSTALATTDDTESAPPKAETNSDTSTKESSSQKDD